MTHAKVPVQEFEKYWNYLQTRDVSPSKSRMIWKDANIKERHLFYKGKPIVPSEEGPFYEFDTTGWTHENPQEVALKDWKEMIRLIESGDHKTLALQ